MSVAGFPNIYTLGVYLPSRLTFPKRLAVRSDRCQSGAAIVGGYRRLALGPTRLSGRHRHSSTPFSLGYEPGVVHIAQVLRKLV